LTADSSPNIGGTVRRVPGALLSAAITAYRAVLSPLIVAMFGPACRFEPSCSEYAHLAIREHGAMRGGLIAVRRILRCRPLGGYGYDPVPSRAKPPAVPRGEIWRPEY
jgi:putative membrane protein insertion efficiency factor